VIRPRTERSALDRGPPLRYRVRMRPAGFALPLSLLATACSSASAGASRDAGADAHRDAAHDGPTEAAVPPCAPAPTLAVTVPPYGEVRQILNACTSAQIASFITACIPGDTTDCTNWLDESANYACKGCLVQQGGSGSEVTSLGGVLLLVDGDSTYFVGGNKPGCEELANSATGGACATVLEPLLQCNFAACLACNPPQVPGCSAVADADGGACSTYVAGTSACQGADAGFATGPCGTDVQAINVICGTGS